MALRIYRNPDGSLKSKWWYGTWKDATGKRYVANLDVEICGTPPADLRHEGDKTFEISKIKARAELDLKIRQAHSNRTAKKLIEKFYEIETGGKIEAPHISDLVKTLAALPRKRKVSPAYEKHRQNIHQRFIDFMRKHDSKVVKLSQVTTIHAENFMQAEDARGVSARTYNETLKIMRQAFRRLQGRMGLPINPFKDIPGHDEESFSREPFTPEDLQAILDAARDDDFLRPLIVTALCTAMRRGDCALLKWRDVNMQARFITVKTAKTGKTVDIPIFPMLFDELHRQVGKDAELVFPEQAAIYRKNPDGLNWRLNKALWQAGFIDDAGQKRAQNGPSWPTLSPAKTRQKGLAAIRAASMTEAKRTTMQSVFTAYMDGKKTGDIARDLDISKGTVSGHLNEVEKMIQAVVIQRNERPLPAVIRGTIHHGKNGCQRLKKASAKGWHSFRTTWITLALTANVPLEIVKRVTGHRTTDVVLEHYFKPGREEFRTALEKAMPTLLMNGTAAALPAPANDIRVQVLALADRMTTKTWRAVREELRALAGG